MANRKLNTRRDKFDSIIVEYLRVTKRTVEELSENVNSSPSSLWRYRKRDDGFDKAPFGVVCDILRITNVSNHDLRIICGLPTGFAEDTDHEN